MTRWLLAAAFLCAAGFAHAQMGGQIGPPVVGGQLPGTTTNNNACAGCLGEFMSVYTTGSTGTATFTAASPTVVTVASWSSTTPANGCFPNTTNCVQPVSFTNSGGALPTGISATVTYFITSNSYSGNTFKLSSTPALAIAGTSDINASDTGSGTQTASNTAILTTTVASGLGSINITAGDWNCNATFLPSPNAATTTSNMFLTIGNSVSVSTGFVSTSGYARSAAALAAGNASALVVGPSRQLLSATTLMIESVRADFAVNVMNASGFLGCRRAR